jgi:hypothetical protein
METKRRLTTRTISKTPSKPRLRWPVRENCRPGRSPTLTADNHHAENSNHRDCAVADARPRAAIPATTATETARPMVPRGLGGERQLLRTRLRQGTASRSQKRLVPGRLARERQLLHSLRVRSCEHPWHHPALSSALKGSRLRSPRDHCSPCHTVLAAANKCLANRNKSRRGSQATKKRETRGSAKYR